MYPLFTRSLLGGLALTTLAAQTVAAPLQPQVDAVIEPLMREHRIAGMAVALYANGQEHYFDYGLASKADATPVTRDTLFEVGSLSKTYTATLVALASAEGKLDLQAPAKAYEPALNGSPLGEASVLELGAYSAYCLPLQFPDEIENDQQALAYLRTWRPSNPRGSQRCYSNQSLGLFGELAAKAWQQPFRLLMSQKVLPPLGLANTWLDVPASAQPLYAQGYDAQDRPVRVNPGPFADQAYGIRTSAADLLRYLRWQLQPEGLPKTLADAIRLTQGGYFQTDTLTQGLGWERYPYPVPLQTLLLGNGVTMIREAQPTRRLQPAQPAGRDYWYNKTGATSGFGAYAVFIPARGVAIALLANRNYPNKARVRAAYDILKALEQ